MVRGDRIVRVGAFLPLSVSAHAREEWGTRHLAALGLTERCDADVLVVSEERGTLSHARQGELTEIEPLQEELVSGVLNSILKTGGSGRRAPRRRSLSFGLWSLALALALLAVPAMHWLNGSWRPGQTDFIVAPAVPITLSNVPENLYLETNDTLHAEVTLRTPRNQEAPITGTPSFNIDVDLKNYPAGVSDVILTSHMISSLPAGWEVERYLPERIRINLIPARNGELPIVAHFVGLQGGLKVTAWQAAPASIPARIKDTGPLVGRTIQTLPIDLSGLRKPGNYGFSVGLDLPPSVEPLRGAPASLWIDVQVAH